MADPRPLPLFAWRDQQRQLRKRRARRRRLIVAAASIGGAAALAVTIIVPPATRWVWNASASAPLGLYRIRPGAAARHGDTVLVWLPESARSLAARRHYLPANVPAVKRVAATAGDQVCARGALISINGVRVGARWPVDPSGRPLPHWDGCLALGPGELFLFNPAAPAAFDGRYFGVVSRSQVIGTAVLVWARPTAESR